MVTEPRLKVSSDRLEKWEIEPETPGVRCLTRAFCIALLHFAMQRYGTLLYRFVAPRILSWTVLRKAICETNHCIGKVLRSVCYVCIYMRRNVIIEQRTVTNFF